MALTRKVASRGDQPLTPAPTILAAKPQPKAIMDEPQAPAPRTHRASGGREAKRAARSARAGVSMPYITRKVGIYEVLDEEGLATIERNADIILAEIGIEYRD